MSIFLWGVLPYLVAVILIGGLAYRYKFDQYGWTSRSSEIHERKILNIASPLFHFGILFVLMGHIMGLFVPKAWTDAIGISQHQYHAGALYIGSIFGFAALFGMLGLLARRASVPAVRKATTTSDVVMYVVLVAAMIAGIAATLFGGQHSNGAEHNYRETVSIWLRSLFTLQPNIEAMEASTTVFKVHVLVALTLFAILPFTRLVHAFSAPLNYLFRPYIVYRSRGKAAPAKKTWQSIGQQRQR